MSPFIWIVLFYAYFCTPQKGKRSDSVAQLVEQYTFNVWVLGSSPSGITKGEEDRGQQHCPLLFFIYTKIRPGGEIGRHVRLRGVFRKMCWFESSPGHQYNSRFYGES